MSGGLGSLNIELALNTIKFNDNLDKAYKQAQKFATNTQTALKRVESGVTNLENATAKLGTLFKTALGTAVSGQVLKFADSYTELQNRMRLVTDSQYTMIASTQSVFDISLKTNQSVSATAEVYQRFAKNAGVLGISLSEVAELTETVSKTVAMSGASTASAEAALMQFGQALASGELRGAELNSVMEQNPPLAQAIADGLGVTVGQLKEMGKNGELEIGKVVKALQKVKSQVDADFDKRVKTLSMSFTNLETSFIKFIGEANQATGVTQKLAEGVEFIAENIGTLLPLALSLGTAFSGIKFAQKAKESFLSSQALIAEAKATVIATQAEQRKIAVELESTRAYIANLQAQINLAKTQGARSILIQELSAQTARETALINAQTNAVQRLAVAKRSANAIGGAIGALGGPIGIATLALSAIIPIMIDFGGSANKAKDDISDFNVEIELSADNLNKMNKAQLEAAKIKLERKIEEQKEKIADLNKEYKLLSSSALPKTTTLFDENSGIVLELSHNQEYLNKLAGDAKIKYGEVSNETEELTGNLIKLEDVNARLAKQGLDAGAESAEKVLKVIEQAQYKLGRSKLQGKALAEFDAQFELKGFENDPKYQEALRLLTQANMLGSGGKGGGKTDYTKQFTEQLSQLQQRLAELKANAKDIELFGEVSQYQEVNKLSQDIAVNAEKYAHFGIDGIAKLKALASAIDSESQKMAIGQFEHENSKKLEAMEFELTLLGKTREEQELIRFNNQLDIEASKLKIGMSQENIAKLDEEIAKLKERHEIIHKTMNENRGSAIEGIKQGMKTIEEDVSNVAGNIANVTTNAFSGMSNALTDLVMTGKANFADMAKAIIKDIIQMTIRMMLFKAISSTFGGFSGGGSVGGIGQHYRGGLVSFDNGGFTGLGGKYTPAGIVHRGEYVITKEATSRIGLDYLNYLNYGGAFGGKRGFSSGGGVSVPRLPTSSFQPNTQPNISVKVINNGEPAQANVSTKQKGGQLELTIELVRNIAKQEASEMIQTNFRPGGAFS
ncbi:tape measure protein [Pasteurella multocida]|uniref:tape measure protein n=1 Tax=Pasteurella multocida TaxID=747 RepID=UPI0029B7CD63|nr:tape measure protein [Pasteurella multocida]MDX3898706.1 tape measure protein [Pasteurella multocida]MDX3956593.1 tape measure protein [Pasteurella multocida]HDR1425100.1 phage tail tape measure protein [Pasteurella multocida]HDR1428976.1 phage tail tape measure protein [Pasteurella multocida]